MAEGLFQARDPKDDAFIESLNGWLRRECLNQHWLLSLDDACVKAERITSKNKRITWIIWEMSHTMHENKSFKVTCPQFIFAFSSCRLRWNNHPGHLSHQCIYPMAWSVLLTRCYGYNTLRRETYYALTSVNMKQYLCLEFNLGTTATSSLTIKLTSVTRVTHSFAMCGNNVSIRAYLYNSPVRKGGKSLLRINVVKHAAAPLVAVPASKYFQRSMCTRAKCRIFEPMLDGAKLWSGQRKRHRYYLSSILPI